MAPCKANDHHAPRVHLEGARQTGTRSVLQRIEERDQVRLLLLGEMHAEAGIVEVD